MDSLLRPKKKARYMPAQHAGILSAMRTMLAERRRKAPAPAHATTHVEVHLHTGDNKSSGTPSWVVSPSAG